MDESVKAKVVEQIELLPTEKSVNDRAKEESVKEKGCEVKEMPVKIVVSGQADEEEIVPQKIATPQSDRVLLNQSQVSEKQEHVSVRQSQVSEQPEHVSVRQSQVSERQS